jgi:CRISPR-associated exonuclease Cas4
MNSGTAPLLLGAVALLFLALAALGLAAHLRRSRGLPQGKIISSDMSRWQRVSEPLYSHDQRLTGRPDYVMRRRGRLIPVEVKPNRDATEPYESDVLQLAAYCLLLEEEGARPTHGVLRYRDRTFRVPYTNGLRHRLHATLDEMRDAGAEVCPLPNHRDPRRCRACGYRGECEQRMA